MIGRKRRNGRGSDGREEMSERKWGGRWAGRVGLVQWVSRGLAVRSILFFIIFIFVRAVNDY